MSTTPSTPLEKYVDDLNQRITTEHEYFIALLVVVFSECGFYVQKAKSSFNDKLQFIPPKHWKITEDVYEMKLALKALPEVRCKLIAITSGDRIILNFFAITKGRTVYTLIVRIIKYINPFSRYFGDRFMNRKEICERFKDELIMKVKADILTEAGIANPSLRGLPTELKFKILSMLDVSSLMRLSKCSRQFNMLCKEPFLWKRLYQQEFGDVSEMLPEEYFMGYHKKKCLKTYRRHLEDCPTHNSTCVNIFGTSLFVESYRTHPELFLDFSS